MGISRQPRPAASAAPVPSGPARPTSNAATTTAATSAPSQSPALAPAQLPTRRLPSFLRLVKRLPFTTGYVVITLVLAIALGTLWTPIESKPWYDQVAFGLPSFENGRWWTLVTGAFFALYPSTTCSWRARSHCSPASPNGNSGPNGPR